MFNAAILFTNFFHVHAAHNHLSCSVNSSFSQLAAPINIMHDNISSIINSAFRSKFKIKWRRNWILLRLASFPSRNSQCAESSSQKTTKLHLPVRIQFLPLVIVFSIDEAALMSLEQTLNAGPEDDFDARSVDEDAEFVQSTVTSIYKLLESPAKQPPRTKCDLCFCNVKKNFFPMRIK